jgi:hypothetical protein
VRVLQGGPVNRSKAAMFIVIVLFTAGVTIGQSNQEPQAVPPSDNGPSCARSLLFNFSVVNEHNGDVHEVPIWRVANSDAFYFVTGMTIDADGSPNAYSPDGTGLDDLRNAGAPGHWEGIIADENGEPVIQGPSDPFPGFYVSCTSLFDRTKDHADPTRYVDASTIPYVVLPREVVQQSGARLGDFAVVVDLLEGKSSYAIFADVGTLGEGSIALAKNLGIRSDARRGGRGRGLLYFVMPGSGNRQPRPIDEINAETEKLLQDFGGAAKLTSCASDQGQGPASSPVASGEATGNTPTPSAN